jgi:hypothetical protein
MTSQRIVAGALALFLAAGSTLTVAQQVAGTIAGRLADAKKPYSDYAVQVRDVTTGLVVATVPVDDQAKFTVTGVTVPNTYLIELVVEKDKKIVCTDGPYVLTTPEPAKLDVNVGCGKVPTAVWLLAAGAGAAAAITVSTRSTSR